MLNSLFDFIKKAIPLIEDIIMLFDKLVKSAITIFTPDKFINDVLFGVIGGIKMIFGGILGSINGDIIGGKESTYNGIFGVSKDEKNTGNLCIKPTLLNLIILILCPPLAIFLNKGLIGTAHIIICMS